MCRFILPTLKLNIERWKWNSEFRVYVSNMGNFKDEHKKPIAIKIGSGSGYVKIKTPYGVKSAHRLVMLTWKPIPNAEEMTVDHLDHNKRNNKLENLEWVDEKENKIRAKEDIYKEVLIDILIKHVVKQLDLSEFNGVLFNPYVKVKIDTKITRIMQEMKGSVFSDYRVNNISFVKTSIGVGTMIIDLSITPYSLLKTINVILEV